MESLSPQVVSAAKLPILNPNEFDLWKMRIEQYFLMTDYSLWEVILNGDSPALTRVIEALRSMRLRLRVLPLLVHVSEDKEPESEIHVSPSKFEDFSDNSINEVNAADSPVPTIGQIFTNSTNTFSVVGPSNTAVSPTHEKSSYVDISQYPDDPNTPELEDITYSDDEEDVGSEADFTNLETTITINNDDFHTCMFACFLSQEEPNMVHQALKDPSWIEAMQEELLQFKMQKVWVLIDLPNGKRAIGFKDPDYPDKVYKVVKVLYGLHQAPRAWYETLANYLLENGFQKGKINQTLFIKRQKDDILLVQIYVDDIIFGYTNKDLCKAFEKLMKDKFKMSSIDTEKPLLKDSDGEDVDVHTYRSMIGSLMYLTSSRSDIMFAVCACARLQVTPKVSYLHAVKKIFRYLKGKPHLGLWYLKDSPFNLVAYSDSDYAGVSRDRKSTTGGCQFLGCRLISWQCKKQTVTSSTKAEYVAAASCCAQVLWIQNQLLDYGLVRNVDSSTKFYMYPRFLQLMIRAQVGDLSSHSTKYSSPALTQKVFANMRRVGKGFSGVDTPLFEGMIVAQQADDVANESAASVAVDDVPAAADEPSISSPTPNTQPPPPSQELPSTSKDKIAQNLEITKLKQRVKKLERRNKLKVSKLRRLKKVGTAQGVDTSEDTVMDDVSQQGGRQAESQAQIYQIDLDHADKVLSMQDDEIEPAKLKEVVEVKTKEQMKEEDNKALKRASESQAKKAAKKQKLDEEATPLARKVLVVDYEVYTENNKSYYKIMRAGGSHQLFLSFLSLLRDFDREDLEVLWQLVKERFTSSKPKNFSDDFLLTTLTYMFEKPDVQAQVWKNQMSVHGLAKVKSWRLLDLYGVHIITFTTT
nr:uncharacterized mitochondrial protein AtMg00810-like [Tanacetum cinerariifolium]